MFSTNWTYKITFFSAILCLFLGTANAHDEVESKNRPQTESDFPGGDFVLRSIEGQVSLKDLEGKAVLMFFGFTSCSDICPMTLAIISRALSMMTPEELNNTTALFISLDPEKDSLELLSRYTAYFHPSIIGVTNHLETLLDLSDRYGVHYRRELVSDSTLGYVIYHTPDILVLDTGGILQERRISPNTEAKEIAAYIKSLLAKT